MTGIDGHARAHADAQRRIAGVPRPHARALEIAVVVVHCGIVGNARELDAARVRPRQVHRIAERVLVNERAAVGQHRESLDERLLRRGRHVLAAVRLVMPEPPLRRRETAAFDDERAVFDAALTAFRPATYIRAEVIGYHQGTRRDCDRGGQGRRGEGRIRRARGFGLERGVGVYGGIQCDHGLL